VEWIHKDAEPVSMTAASDPDGKLNLAYPVGDSFRNTGVRLSVSTDFARSAPSSTALKDIDAASRVEASFRHFDDVGKSFSGEAFVPGGPFIAGAVARDRRASRKEAPRQAETPDIYIDLYPVTNALYEMYLEDTKAETFPEYWDNPQYNQPEQPVIGISYYDAVRFAAWLSAQLGVVKRLPTEDEWEKAARGGQDVIYPWGDQSPADGGRANYDGNGRFSAPSPVGSFEAGKNAYGLFDMAGNVWEWTSTYGAATGSLIVKGGSWMDGPADLRISNRRESDPARGYVDVGFRLLREVIHE
jgi:formylglycine-generating enzyme required for sulfatase activity